MSHILVVKKVRELTDLGLKDSLDCVNRAGGDLQKALEFAKEKNLGRRPIQEYNPTKHLKNGAIASYVTEDGQRGGMVEVLCETDFAAKSNVFQAAVKEAAQIYVTGHPSGKTLTMIVNELREQLKEGVQLGRCRVFNMGDSDEGEHQEA